MKQLPLIFIVLFSAFVAACAQKNDGEYLVNVNPEGVMLEGYDVVAYFTDGKPVKGSERFRSDYDHATYYFASQAHLNTFTADPQKCAPKYGGYCAVAAAMNKVEEVEVDKFKVYEGHLYMNRNAKAEKVWNQDPPGIVGKAEKNWPELVKRHGKKD